MMKKVKLGRKSLLEKIRKEFPQVHFSQFAINNKGWDYTTVILDNQYVFRFPKDEKYIKTKRLKMEIRLLKTLRRRISSKIPEVRIPEYISIAKDYSFGGYKLIKGKPLTKMRFKKLRKRQQDLAAQQLGKFLAALHNFPQGEARKAGVIQDWPLPKERKEYEKRKKQIFSVLSAEERRQVRKFCKEYFSLKTSPKLSLIHLDFRREHILVQNGKIQGIIDFGDCSFGDPAKDFAGLWEYGDKFCLDVYNVYSRYAGRKDEDFLQRSRYYDYAGSLSLLYHGVAGKKKRLLKKGLKKIRELGKEKAGLL